MMMRNIWTQSNDLHAYKNGAGQDKSQLRLSWPELVICRRNHHEEHVTNPQSLLGMGIVPIPDHLLYRIAQKRRSFNAYQ